MKKYLLLMLLAVPVLLMGCSKSESEDDEDDEVVLVSLNVTNIVDNQATVTASITEGNFYRAMMVEAVRSYMVDVDYTSEVKLINYVKANGVDVELPYSHTVTGLKGDDEMFSAVIVFNAAGRATNSDYQIWTVVGEPEKWSDDNTAGTLGEIIWNGEDEGGDEGGDQGGDEGGDDDEGGTDGSGTGGELGEEEW